MGCGDSKEKKQDKEAPKNEIPEYKVIVIGDSSVGKTAIIHSYIQNSGPIQPTLGVQNQYKIVNVPGGGVNGIPKQIKLDIWDTAGQEQFKSMVRNFYQGSHAVLIVYGVNSSSSFKSIDGHLSDFEQIVSSQDVIKLIVGNKCDLDVDRRVQYDDL